MTGLEMVRGALELIGATSPADGDPSAEDATTALQHANRMRTSWNARGIALHAVERAVYAWTASASSRTIGPSGAQLTGTRPVQILAAKVIPAGQATEITVEVISHTQYAEIADKTQPMDYFTRLLYEPTGATIGTLTVWPVPTSAPSLILHNKVLLSAITLGSELTVPEAYEAALVSQLAKRLAPIFGKSWTRELDDIAKEDWTTVLRANIRIPDVVSLNRDGGPMRKSTFQSGTV